MRPVFPVLVSMGVFVSCGTDAARDDATGSSNGNDANGANRDSGAASPASPASPTAPAGPTDLVGVWTVEGTDSRGAYAGEAELRDDGGKLRFVRAVRYLGTPVEDGRELHWAFVGEAKGDRTREVAVSVVLDNRDFVRARGGIARSIGDAPIAVNGVVRLEAGVVQARYSGGKAEGVERWTLQLVDHGVSPKFSLSPYPSLPWKNDWMSGNRAQSLRTYPLFEDAMDVYRFRTEMLYRGDATLRFGSPEYLVAYWFGRKSGLIGPTD